MALDPVVGGLISTGINAAGTFAAGAMNQHYAEQNAEQSYRLGQKAQINAAGNMVEGFKRAGLSPALVAGANFSAAGGISGQGGNTPAPQSADFSLAANMQKQNELVDAQIRNVDAQTQAINNQNKAFSDEDTMVAEYAKVMAERWKTSDWYDKLPEDTRNTIDAVATGEHSMSIGGMRALVSSIESQGKLSDNDFKLVKNGFDAQILRSRFDDKDLFMAEIAKPLTAQNFTYAQIQEIGATILKHQAEILELAERGNLHATQVAQILANDDGLLLKAKDWGQFTKLKFNKMLDGAAEAVTWMLPGAQFAKGARALTGFGRRTASQVRRMNANPTFKNSTLMRLDHNSSAVHQINFGPSSNFHPNARF